MSALRWDKTLEHCTRGELVPVWTAEDFELSRNVNLGLEGGWVFELCEHGKRLSLHASLSEGKAAAAELVAAREAETARLEVA